MLQAAYQSSLWRKADKSLSHGFFGRQGGVSKGAFSSLNGSPYSGDEPACIAQNRQRVSDALGANVMVSQRQVHCCDVNVIHEQNIDQVLVGDAMVTRVRGVALAILTADCAPLLFYDAHAGVIGAAHAGWGGALSGVAEATIRVMCEQGAEVSNIHCVIGPAIQRMSYQVDMAFKNKFERASPIAVDNYFSPWQSPESNNADPRFHFDLSGYLVTRLLNAGVALDAIDNCCIDTYQNATSYFSYRRNCHEGLSNYGRQMSALVLNESLLS